MKSIYFVTPDMKSHSRGILNIYKNVINLNKLGFKAYVVHLNSQFKKIDWYKFGNDLPFLKFHYLDKLFVINQQGQFVKANKEFGENDIWIIPEGFPILFPIFKQHFKFNCKMYMYAQGWSYILPSLASVFNGQIPHFNQIGVDGVISVSTCVTQYIKDVFGVDDSFFYTIPNYIDTAIFNKELGMEKVEEVVEDADGNLDIVEVEKLREKKNIITFMPRRGIESKYQVTLTLLDKLINKTEQKWQFKPIVNLSQEDVAKELKDSKIFLNFTDGEGFGMAALEAIMTGNIVVGNAGLGSEEFLNETKWEPADDTNNPYSVYIALLKAIEQKENMSEKTYNKLKEKYSEKNYLKQLSETFKQLTKVL